MSSNGTHAEPKPLYLTDEPALKPKQLRRPQRESSVDLLSGIPPAMRRPVLEAIAEADANYLRLAFGTKDQRNAVLFVLVLRLEPSDWTTALDLLKNFREQLTSVFETDQRFADAIQALGVPASTVEPQTVLDWLNANQRDRYSAIMASQNRGFARLRNKFFPKRYPALAPFFAALASALGISLGAKGATAGAMAATGLGTAKAIVAAGSLLLVVLAALIVGASDCKSGHEAPDATTPTVTEWRVISVDPGLTAQDQDLQHWSPADNPPLVEARTMASEPERLYPAVDAEFLMATFWGFAAGIVGECAERVGLNASMRVRVVLFQGAFPATIRVVRVLPVSQLRAAQAGVFGACVYQRLPGFAGEPVQAPGFYTAIIEFHVWGDRTRPPISLPMEREADGGVF